MTEGLAITNYTNDARFMFFEIDFPFIQKEHDLILATYAKFGIDVLVHRSFAGIHYISPTLLSKEGRLFAMLDLQEVNKKCPCVTLRIKPNKYGHLENNIWFHKAKAHYNNDTLGMGNSKQLSNLLNHWFGSHFVGLIDTELKFVNYPLPFIKAKHEDIEMAINDL